jgi:hypothetical protein
MENITFNGLPAIKSTAQIINGKYDIRLMFIHDGNIYEFSFRCKDLNSAETLYNTVTPTIELK